MLSRVSAGNYHIAQARVEAEDAAALAEEQKKAAWVAEKRAAQEACVAAKARDAEARRKGWHAELEDHAAKTATAPDE